MEAQETTLTSTSSSPSILNPYPRRLPGPALLHHLVRHVSPNHLPAIDHQAANGTRETLSYAEFHSRAEVLSRRILASRPRAQEQNQLVVPVLLPQCPELYVSQLAILKAGGAFCPLNLDAPPERVKFILNDVSAKVVVTSTALRHEIDALELHAVVVTADQEDSQHHVHQGEGSGTAPDVKPDSLAYVMYTSGSTGTPKGVGISHDAATQALLAHDPHIPSFSRFLQFAAPTFDVSVFEIFFPFFRGVTLVSCHRAALLNDLPAVLRTMHVDACELTPTVAGSLLRTRDNAPGLRLLLTIGEMLTEPVIKEFGGRTDKPSVLWAMYGPTEATIHCTLQPSCEASASSHNVGFPLDTVSAFILTPLNGDGSGDFQILPKGELGELAVGGHQLAMGYINRPEQTAKVFVNTPYGRLYRTGDKALIRENGALECYGRISDGQIKLRGQRIELGEIEQAVLRSPGCHGAVATVVQGIIVVFCEQDVLQETTTDEIHRTCRDWLPAFMLPGDIVAMQSFPRLPSGKVDRKQLNSDYQASQEHINEFSRRYQDDNERKLAQHFQEVLGIRLGSDSVLSAAGVDSLAAIKVAARLRKAGYNIGAIDVLNSRTLSHLRLCAQRFDEEVASTAEETTQVPIEVAKTASDLGFNPDEIERVEFCAPVQVSMLAETLRHPEAYCNWVELQVPATRDVGIVGSWFQDAIRCNEILRTGFISSQNGFEQVIWKPTAPVSVEVVRRFDRKYRLDERGFARPFSVQVLANRSRKRTTVLMQIHHALYDGWSLDLLVSDLNLLAQGKSISSRPPFRHLSTYYHSDQHHIDAVVARDYWADYLLGYQPIPMPQMLSKTIRIDTTLSAQKTLAINASGVRAAAARLDISTQVVFQACLLWLWGSILGTEDVVVGNVTSGRTVRLQGLEDMIGPCLTTIPIRARIAQARTVKELLEFIHISNRESLAHCTLPLTEIKKVAGFSPGQPLYDALFVFQESVPSREGQHSPTNVRQIAHKDYLETKLLVEIEPLAEGYQLRTTYHADVFHHGYMQLFLRQFECILAHIISNMDADIASIASCFSGNLISVHNGQPKALGNVGDLAALFEKTAAAKQDKPAICFLGSPNDQDSVTETISYNELNRLSNQIARHLRALGTSTNDTVVIVMEKSIMLYAGILAILKCGCAYLPLLPSTPTARMQTILSQARPRLCVHDATISPRSWNAEECKFTSLEKSILLHYDDNDLGTPIDSSRIANIIYTSGSTGVPKGVCVSQLNICSNLDVLSRIYPVKDGSRMLQACSQAFDVSVFEILFALTRGMCLCSATNDTLFADLEGSLRTLQVTHISMTPTVASLIEPSNVPKVEFLVTSGEPMTNEVARKWAGKLYQGYGPSETTNICSVKKMTPDDHIRHLGFTFENTSALVLSPHGLDVMPIGSVGELCFGGDQVVPGYLNLPKVTSEKFIQHPKYGRLYRSGDVGRMLADGSLLIVGRIDDQVKLRGQRIELGEINATVASFGAVSNSVTLLVNSGSSVQLACYYVPCSGDGNQLQILSANRDAAQRNMALYDTLRSKLPSYMVPSYLIPISTVPMTSSGKVDKARLKQLFGKLSPSDLQAFGADAAPGDTGGQWSDEEDQIATVVAKELKVSRSDVGRWTPLTSLGLDSITAISVAKSLQRRFSRKVPISHVLRNNSVAKLSSLLVTAEDGKAVVEGKPRSLLPPELVEVVGQQLHARGLDYEQLLPCTPLQEAMLASSSGTSAYLNKMLLRLSPNAVEMKTHWASMFQRHGILRTCFFSTGSREHALVQAILKQWEPDWLSFSTDASSLNEAIDRHAMTVPPAMNSDSPAVSLATIQDADVVYLSFICHHAYYDGMAISRLLKEVGDLVSGVELPAAPSYEPFLREMLRLPESTGLFWKQHLNGFKPTPLPHSPGGSSGRGLLVRNLTVSYSDIRDRLKVINSTLLSLIQASWASLLHIILQNDNVCFGNVVSGRTLDIERLDELVAPCFNTLPLRINFQEHKLNTNVIKAFQSLNIETLQYQFTPLRQIQSRCSSGGARLFDTLLILQQAPRLPDKCQWTLERDEGDMDVPLVCEVTPHPDTDDLEVKLHHDRSLYSDAFTSFMYDTLAHLIGVILQYPSAEIASKHSLPPELQVKLGDLMLVHPPESDEQRAFDTTMTKDWNQTEKTIRSVLSRISTTHEDRISRNTTIFQLGLDSINAVQVAAMLREAGFPNVTATDILENPNCSMLAARLAGTQSKTKESIIFDIASFQERARQNLQSILEWDSIETILPCSPLQMGMLKEFIDSQGREYLNFVSLHVDAEFNQDVSLLKASWCQLMESHDILRIGFSPLDLEDTSFAMLQYKFLKHAVPVTEYGEESAFSFAAWKQQVTEDVFRKIEQPPWRVAIVKAAEGIHMHVAINHAIYDAQTLRFLFKDLAGSLSGQPVACRPSIAAVVQDILTQTCRSREAGKLFWEKQAPLAVINKFPTMTPLKESDGSLLVKTRTCSLSLAALEDHAKNAGVTIQAVSQATWSRVLASYLGEASVVFGTVLSGRNSDDTRDAVFPCITTLPVIARYSQSNREVLQSMMEYNIGLQRHQRTPLTDIQRWVGHPSTKLFDTLLVYQKLELEEDEEELWQVHEEQAAVDYPISIEIQQCKGSVDFCITFANNILPVQQAEILLEQFDAVFCDLVVYPDGDDESVREIRPDLFAIFPAEEPELVSKTQFLHEFVEVSAQQYPEKVALNFVSCFRDSLPVSREWTYKGLCANGNKVANILGDYVKTGDIVAICFDKCPEAHFAMLGILKAGCAFLALDPGAPASRKEFILQDSGAVVLLTDLPRSLNTDFNVEVPVISISEDSLQEASASPFKLSRPLEPADRSYCLYTSGTTGTPKGCEITHENAVQAMLAFQKLFEGHWDENSRWLQFASYHFDVSVLEQYWTWSVGIALFAAPRDIILEDLVGTISTLQITHIDLTPSLARLVHPDDVPSLCRGVFITGGEQLKQEILDVWGPRRVIHNFYGPTEATIGVTTYPRVPINGKSSNIGKQFANVGSYVLRPGTEIPVLRGGVGELCVSGKLVGKGYLNREDLTAERFPTLQMYNERVYRTGDLVRVLYDGCFDFLGRADDQVKLRGQRLEIGEINHCIRTGVPEIKDVVTVVVRNEKQQKDLLVTFVVTAQDHQNAGELRVITGREAQTLSSKALRSCREKLPGYMVPTYVLLLPFVPLSPNNKAELKVLRTLFNTLSPEQLIAPSSMATVTNLGKIGKTLRRALSRMSGVAEKDISPASSIFELGVDSISVMRLARILKQEDVRNVTPAMILRNPILVDLAEAVGGIATEQSLQTQNGTLEAEQALEACQHRHRGFVCRTLGVKSEEIDYIAPCSALQQGMISRSKTMEDSGAYFNTFRFELAKNVSLPKLRLAWEMLLRKYSIMRTRFVSTTEGYVQASLKEATLPWSETTLDHEQELHVFLEQKLRAWVDGNEQHIGRPWEIHVVTDGDKRWLAMHIFHGIYDATSFDLMIDEVAELYTGRDPVIKGPNFLDALLQGPLRNLSFSKNFWATHLKRATATPLPKLSDNPAHKDLVVSREIEFDTLEEVRKALGVTQQAIIQALWSLVLQQHFIIRGVTFGVIVSGRAMELENAENVIGPLFNTIPYHYEVSKSHRTWSSVIRQCHEFNTAVLPFQHVSLRDVQKWCSGGRPLFDTLFSFQRRVVVPQQSAEGLWLETESSINPDYPLAFEATLDPEGGLHIVLVAQKGVADERALAEMLDEFEAKARAIAEDVNGLCHASNYFDAFDEQQEATLMGETNEPQSQSVESFFEWTSEAQAIRQQIALLSEVEEATVLEHTTLLELGLDSIDTVKLSARLKRVGISLSNSDLIKGQSIAVLTALLASKESQAQGSGATDSGYSSGVDDYSPAALDRCLAEIGADLSGIELILPPTPLQDSMLSEMISSDFQLYFNHDVLEVSPNTDLGRLKEAWLTVAKNTPVLRTVFVEVESQELDFAYMQLVSKTCDRAFREVEVQSSDEIALIKTQARERALRGRGRSDLFQVAFVRSPQSAFVVLSVAHALYDGWSLGLLHQDVEAAYRSTYSPRPTYTGYLRKVLRSSRKGAQEFWSDYISDARRTILPPQQAPGSSKGVNNRGEIVTNLSSVALKSFCKHHGISQQALAQACWAVVLATYSQRLDVTFGVVLSGRETEASEAMLFPTMNTVPVRAVFHGSTSSFLRYMQDNMTNISQFQQYPLRKIQALAQHGQGSLFNTLFMLQKGIETIHSKEDLMKSIEGTSAVEYPVCVEMEVIEDRLLWRTACDSQYLPFDSMSRLLKDIENAMDFLVTSPDEDILKFGDDGVSICGLPPFQPRGFQTTENPGEKQQADDDGVWSPVENTIRSVIAEMAGVEPASVNKRHNLYHLGLDSIRAIKVSSALRKRGVTVTVRDLIQASSIQDMAAKTSEAVSVIEKSMGISSAEALTNALSIIQVDQVLAHAGFGTADVAEILPATAMQTHMLSVWHNAKGAVFYPEFRYRLAGVNGIQLVEQAWDRLIDQNPILRIIFLATGSDKIPFLQVVLPAKSSVRNPFVSFSVRHLDNDNNDKSLFLRLRIHHALYDGVSLPLIMSQFKALLGQESVLLDSEQQSLSWKLLLASSFDVRASQRRRSFWLEYLRDCSSTPSSIESAHGIRPTTADSGFSMDEEDKIDDKANNDRLSILQRAALPDTTNLKSRCTQHGVSLQAVFLAAYARVLAASRQNGASGKDVVFGVYLANRGTRDTLQEAAYPTLCLVPLRVVEATSRSLFDVAAQVQKDVHQISAAENISVGLWEIKNWTGVVLDSFVNFLSLPDGDDEEILVGSRDDIRLEAIDNISEGANSMLVDAGLEAGRAVDPVIHSWVHNNAVKDAYLDAVDIEASLQGDGAMDIGVFGSCARLGDVEGRDLIHMIVDSLRSAE